MKMLTACMIALSLIACQSDDAKEQRDSVAPSNADTWSDDDADSDADDPVGTDECDDAAGETICIDGAAVQCDNDGTVGTIEDCEASAETCFDGLGCAQCGVEVTVAHMIDDAESAFLRVRPAITEENADWERFHGRPVTVSSVDPDLNLGDISWSVEGDGFSLIEDESTEGSSAPASEPASFLVHAHAMGSAQLTVTHSLCPEESATVNLHSARQPPLTARTLSEAPWAERVRVFNQEESVQTVLHSGRHADRLGLPFDVYIVDRKQPWEWADDPSLVDVSDSGPNRTRLASGGVQSNRVLASDRPLSIGATRMANFDVVYDFNRNATLDPGDIMMGPGDGQPGVVSMGDLHEPGPLDVETFQHSGGTWYTQIVYYPASIESMSSVPLVVISHGNGHNYQWYDYLGEHLASHGYVVMSHTNQTGPGIETASTTLLENTDYFLAELDDLEGGVLDGKVDSSRIVWIGHSCGGEGVVRAYDRMVDEGYDTDFYSAEDIILISSIAPTVFYTVEYSNPHDVPYHLFAGAADGDVHGAPTNSVVQFFRLTSAAESAKQVTYLHGVGHNEFNCCGFDDATGPSKLGREPTQDISKAYYLALIRAYASGNKPSLDFFTRRADLFRPQGLDPDAIIVNEYRPDPDADAVAIDDFQSAPELDEASGGAGIRFTVDAKTEDLLADTTYGLSDLDFDPMNGMSQACCEMDENRGLVFEWNRDASIWWDLDEPTDLEPFTWLSFRAAQATRDDYTTELGSPLDFSVTLIDSSAVQSTIWFGQFGQISTPYLRWGYGGGFGWSNEFNTVRLRLSDFADSQEDLDLGRIETVQFKFGPSHGSPIGRIGIDDVLLEY
jgi:hypothetical protein